MKSIFRDVYLYHSYIASIFKKQTTTDIYIIIRDVFSTYQNWDILDREIVFEIEVPVSKLKISAF